MAGRRSCESPVLPGGIVVLDNGALQKSIFKDLWKLSLADAVLYEQFAWRIRALIQKAPFQRALWIAVPRDSNGLYDSA